jgi:hypothetical protein
MKIKTKADFEEIYLILDGVGTRSLSLSDGRHHRLKTSRPHQRQEPTAGVGSRVYMAGDQASSPLVIPYFRRKRSTRPAVSMIFCLPV